MTSTPVEIKRWVATENELGLVVVAPALSTTETNFYRRKAKDGWHWTTSFASEVANDATTQTATDLVLQHEHLRYLAPMYDLAPETDLRHIERDLRPT